MKYKILLLGKNGQLGHEFVNYFNLYQDFKIDAFDHGELDITDREKIFVIIKENAYNLIINCTAYNAVDLAEDESNLANAVNFLGVKNLAEAAKINNAKLIHFSTDYIFDGNQRKPYCEYDNPNPLSVYGMSKFYGEQAIKEVCKNYLIIRVSWVFGGKNNFVTKLINWSKQSQELEIISNQISSPTYTYDLVKAVQLLINKNISGTFHITNTPVRKIEWARYILAKINWTGKIHAVDMESVEFKASRPKYAILDNSLFQYSVNWEMPNWQDSTDRFLKRMKIL